MKKSKRSVIFTSSNFAIFSFNTVVLKIIVTGSLRIIEKQNTDRGRIPLTFFQNAATDVTKINFQLKRVLKSTVSIK